MANSLTATVAKVPDGDVSFGNKNGEIFTLSDAPSSYPTGGYPLVGGEAVTNNNALASTQNIDLWRIDTVMAWGQQQGYNPKWNVTYQKLQLWQVGTANNPEVEVPNGTDVSGFVFLLCAIGS